MQRNIGETIMQRINAAVFALLLVAGCAEHMAPQQPVQARSLAIVTGFGEQIELNFVGFTAFTNGKRSAKVDWQIDRHFKQRAATELGGRYDIRQVSYDPAILRQETGSIFGPDPAIALVRSVVTPGTADIIVYFGPTTMEDTLGRSNQYVGGLGLYSRSVFGFGSRDSAAYAAWRGMLFDGKTLQPLGQTMALLPFDLLTLRSRIPHIPSGITVPEKYEDLNPAQQRLARDLIFKIIADTMPQVLTELKLR
jgi:hypothetical protein